MTDYPQFCAIARAAEVIGERWTLLIFRELYLGPKRYSDLLERLQPVAPAVLNGRLRKLEARGLIVRSEVGPPTPARLFELTAAGRALEPALFELLRWGSRYLFPMRPGERFEADWLRMVLMAYARTGAVPDASLALKVAGDSTVIGVSGGPGGVTITAGATNPDATITAEVTALMGLMSGRLSLRDGLEQGSLQVEGSIERAAAIEAMFHHSPA